MDSSDPDDIYSWENIQTCPEDMLIERIESWGFNVESNERPFEPDVLYDEDMAWLEPSFQ